MPKQKLRLKGNKRQVYITFDGVHDLSNNLRNIDYIWDLWARTDNSVRWSRLNLLSVPDCIQNHASRTRSLISSSSYLVSARARTFDYRASRMNITVRNSVRASLDIRRYRFPFVRFSAGYIVDVSPFFSLLYAASHAASFCKPSWRTNANVTPLCGVPPAVGVTSGGGAERRKPIVASTRPNHLRFCGQAIHVPSGFSRYSLTAHRDRDEPGYRLLLPRNPRHRTREAFLSNEPLSAKSSSKCHDLYFISEQQK